MFLPLRSRGCVLRQSFKEAKQAVVTQFEQGYLRYLLRSTRGNINDAAVAQSIVDLLAVDAQAPDIILVRFRTAFRLFICLSRVVVYNLFCIDIQA